MMAQAEANCDVLIVGGGLVGSALANALRLLPLEVILAESSGGRDRDAAGFDARATALSSGSRQILENLGVWHNIAPAAAAITHIHISERGRFAAARIDAAEQGVAALGHTIENRRLGAALWSSLIESAGFRRLTPARCIGVRQAGGFAEADIDVDGSDQLVRARVIIAADGARSGLRDALGIGVLRDDYGQTAVIFNCRAQALARGLAIERFTPRLPSDV